MCVPGNNYVKKVLLDFFSSLRAEKKESAVNDLHASQRNGEELKGRQYEMHV